MPEYIDKTALYKEILLLESCQRELAEEKEVDEYTFIKRQQALEAAICYRQFVANFPAADVAPVVHGRWTTPRAIIECSKCGFGMFPDGYFFEFGECVHANESQYRPNFCPNCGVKLDLEDD